MTAWRHDRARYGVAAWQREPTIFAVASYRLAQGLRQAEAPHAVTAAWGVAHRWIGSVVGVEIPPESDLGPGLRVYHGGAVVVHAAVVAGTGCTLRQGVTLGERRAGGPVPVIGNDVEFGAHAQVLGGIHIGDGARIGALALVLNDVGAGGAALAPRADVRAGRGPAVAPSPVDEDHASN